MDYANYWASAVATADLGDTISQSLRFPSSQHLYRAITADSAGTISTFSFWVKFGKEDNSGTETIFSYSGYVYCQLSPTKVFKIYGGAVDSDWSGKIRDHSAWYHIVIQGDGNNSSSNNKCWMNGREITSEFNNQDFPGLQYGSTFKIGVDTNGNVPLVGYLADFICVNGSAVAPTSFGKYNEDGVWVPVDYSGSYGSKGFRLTFDSSQTNGIGHDSSGNGNHFTATGFDTADIGLYSSGLAASSAGSYESNAGSRTLEVISPEQAFDGNLAAQCQANGSAAWLYWTTNIACSTVTLIVNNDTDQTPDAIYINGSSVTVPTPTLNGSNYESTVSVSGGTLTEFAFKNQGGPNTSIFGMKVDGGSVLVDNTDNDVDFFDTPTSNYGTWNPIHTAEGNKGTFTDANLQTANGSGGDYIAPSTIACGDGHWYWEVRVDGVQSTGYPMIGILDYESAKPEWGGGASNTEGCLYWTTGQFGAFVTQGSESSYGATFTTGDIIGVEYNGSNGQLTFYKNGTSQGLATTVAASRRENMIPGVSAGNNGSAEVSVNFGQMDFIYTVPTGAKKLQTNNLSEQTIKNGKEHFDTVTYTGSSSAKTVTGLEFQPDLIWFKSTSHSTSHAWFDSVRGTSAGYVSSDAQGAEETSNATLTSFNSDGFTTGVPVSNEYNNGGGRTYVAWCWKAGGAAVSNGNGSITSSVSANTDAGFSIVSYTGNLTAGATVGHGLTSAPELIMVKARDFSQTWHVKHSSIGNNTDSLSLDTTAAGINYNAWNNTAPTSSVFSLGPINGTNKSGNDYIAYCWHSVEGFSKFGSFSGNADADGTFVYLGFRPSLIIWKSTSSGTDWQMRDIERDGNVNPVNLTLYPNVNSSEYSGGSADVDFLSNGFKMRTGDTNVNGGTMLYMAWAEHPFGGENVPPATAR
jgi:hypothetical protein